MMVGVVKVVRVYFLFLSIMMEQSCFGYMFGNFGERAKWAQAISCTMVVPSYLSIPSLFQKEL